MEDDDPSRIERLRTEVETLKQAIRSELEDQRRMLRGQLAVPPSLTLNETKTKKQGVSALGLSKEPISFPDPSVGNVFCDGH